MVVPIQKLLIQHKIISSSVALKVNQSFKKALHTLHISLEELLAKIKHTTMSDHSSYEVFQVIRDMISLFNNDNGLKRFNYDNGGVTSTYLLDHFRDVKQFGTLTSLSIDFLGTNSKGIIGELVDHLLSIYGEETGVHILRTELLETKQLLNNCYSEIWKLYTLYGGEEFMHMFLETYVTMDNDKEFIYSLLQNHAQVPHIQKLDTPSVCSTIENATNIRDILGLFFSFLNKLKKDIVSSKTTILLINDYCLVCGIVLKALDKLQRAVNDVLFPSDFPLGLDIRLMVNNFINEITKILQKISIFNQTLQFLCDQEQTLPIMQETVERYKKDSQFNTQDIGIFLSEINEKIHKVVDLEKSIGCCDYNVQNCLLMNEVKDLYRVAIKCLLLSLQTIKSRLLIVLQCKESLHLEANHDRKLQKAEMAMKQLDSSHSSVEFDILPNEISNANLKDLVAYFSQLDDKIFYKDSDVSVLMNTSGVFYKICILINHSADIGTNLGSWPTILNDSSMIRKLEKLADDTTGHVGQIITGICSTISDLVKRREPTPLSTKIYDSLSYLAIFKHVLITPITSECKSIVECSKHNTCMPLPNGINTFLSWLSGFLKDFPIVFGYVNETICAYEEMISLCSTVNDCSLTKIKHFKLLCQSAFENYNSIYMTMECFHAIHRSLSGMLSFVDEFIGFIHAINTAHTAYVTTDNEATQLLLQAENLHQQLFYILAHSPIEQSIHEIKTILFQLSNFSMDINTRIEEHLVRPGAFLQQWTKEKNNIFLMPIKDITETYDRVSSFLTSTKKRVLEIHSLASTKLSNVHTTMQKQSEQPNFELSQPENEQHLKRWKQLYRDCMRCLRLFLNTKTTNETYMMALGGHVTGDLFDVYFQTVDKVEVATELSTIILETVESCDMFTLSKHMSNTLDKMKERTTSFCDESNATHILLKAISLSFFTFWLLQYFAPMTDTSMIDDDFGVMHEIIHTNFAHMRCTYSYYNSDFFYMYQLCHKIIINHKKHQCLCDDLQCLKDMVSGERDLSHSNVQHIWVIFNNIIHGTSELIPSIMSSKSIRSLQSTLQSARVDIETLQAKSEMIIEIKSSLESMNEQLKTCVDFSTLCNLPKSTLDVFAQKIKHYITELNNCTRYEVKDTMNAIMTTKNKIDLLLQATRRLSYMTEVHSTSIYRYNKIYVSEHNHMHFVTFVKELKTRLTSTVKSNGICNLLQLKHELLLYCIQNRCTLPHDMDEAIFQLQDFLPFIHNQGNSDSRIYYLHDLRYDKDVLANTTYSSIFQKYYVLFLSILKSKCSQLNTSQSSKIDKWKYHKPITFEKYTVHHQIINRTFINMCIDKAFNLTHSTDIFARLSFVIMNNNAQDVMMTWCSIFGIIYRAWQNAHGTHREVNLIDMQSFVNTVRQIRVDKANDENSIQYTELGEIIFYALSTKPWLWDIMCKHNEPEEYISIGMSIFYEGMLQKFLASSIQDLECTGFDRTQYHPLPYALFQGIEIDPNPVFSIDHKWLSCLPSCELSTNYQLRPWSAMCSPDKTQTCDHHSDAFSIYLNGIIQSDTSVSNISHHLRCMTVGIAAMLLPAELILNLWYVYGDGNHSLIEYIEKSYELNFIQLQLSQVSTAKAVSSVCKTWNIKDQHISLNNIQAYDIKVSVDKEDSMPQFRSLFDIALFSAVTGIPCISLMERGEDYPLVCSRSHTFTAYGYESISLGESFWRHNPVYLCQRHIRESIEGSVEVENFFLQEFFKNVDMYISIKDSYLLLSNILSNLTCDIDQTMLRLINVIPSYPAKQNSQPLVMLCTPYYKTVSKVRLNKGYFNTTLLLKDMELLNIFLVQDPNSNAYVELVLNQMCNTRLNYEKWIMSFEEPTKQLVPYRIAKLRDYHRENKQSDNDIIDREDSSCSSKSLHSSCNDHSRSPNEHYKLCFIESQSVSQSIDSTASDLDQLHLSQCSDSITTTHSDLSSYMYDYTFLKADHGVSRPKIDAQVQVQNCCHYNTDSSELQTMYDHTLFSQMNRLKKKLEYFDELVERNINYLQNQ